MHLPRGVAAAALLLTSAVAAPAAATTLEVPTLGFVLTVAPPGARVCRIVPPDVEGGAGCAGLDVHGIESRLATQKEKPAGLVILRFADATMVLNLVSRTELRMVNAEALGGFFEGVRSSLPGHPPPHGDGGQAYDLLKLNGVDVARSSFHFDVPKDDPMYASRSVRAYVFAGRDGAVMGTFSTDAPHGAALASVADAIAGTVSMRHAGLEDFGESQAFFIGKLIGMAIFPLGGLIAVIVMVLRGRRRAAEAGRAG